MCGITGVVGSLRTDRATLQRMNDALAPPRSRRRGLLLVGRRRPGHAPPGDHRRRRRRPADLQRGPQRLRRLQRRDLQLPRPARGAREPRASVRDAVRHRSHRPRLRGVRRRVRRAAVGHVRAGAVGQPRDSCCCWRAIGSARSRWCTTPTRTAGWRSRPRCRRCSRIRPCRARSTRARSTIT